jgi:hypothetical protein
MLQYQLGLEIYTVYLGLELRQPFRLMQYFSMPESCTAQAAQPLRQLVAVYTDTFYL